MCIEKTPVACEGCEQRVEGTDALVPRGCGGPHAVGVDMTDGTHYS